MVKKKWYFLFFSMVFMTFLVSCAKTEDTGKAPGDTDISPSLVYDCRMELDYAEEFTVDYYDGGYALITISEGSRFLIVPENAPIPEKLDGDIVILQQPIDHIYLVATAVMDMFQSLNGLDTIRLSGTKAENWYVEGAKAAMDRGDMLYDGKYNAPDYERILAENCKLAIENTMIGHAPEVREKLESFGIPVFVDYSSYEKHPLGRTEWVKLYGTLLGKTEEAQKAFNAQKKILEEISGQENTGKTVAYFYITTNGTVNVRKSSDYVPKMIELAGGKYIFGNLGDDGSRSSSVNMQMEEFYATAKDADYLIYNSTIDGELQTVDQLLGKCDLLKDFKAVKEGNVWCASGDFYQASMSLGTFISDVHQMLLYGKDASTVYIYPLA